MAVVVAQQMYSHVQHNIFGEGDDDEDDEEEGPSHDANIVSFH